MKANIIYLIETIIIMIQYKDIKSNGTKKMQQIRANFSSIF